MTSVFECLPEELITLILSKLPVKSLLRFKCVQKSWNTLINSPRFVRLHRSSSSSFSSTSSINHDCFVVTRRIPLEGQVLSFYSYETLGFLGNEINISISNCTWFCGSCNGLVCLSNNINQILICNPTIRELRSLSFPPSLRDRSGFNIECVAFGSDPNTGQYSLVMIVVPQNSPRFHDGEDREVQVFDFSTDSWRETATAFPVPFRFTRRVVSFNGAFHWCPWDENRILTLQISNEVTEFGFIPQPDFVSFLHQKERSVSSKSQLSLILYGLNGRIEICVMTEYGVKESWTKLFNIEPMLAFFEPLLFWDEHQLLVRTSQGELVSCNLQNQDLRHFPVVGEFDLCPYSQSLVSVNGIGHPIV